jgi:DNA primase
MGQTITAPYSLHNKDASVSTPLDWVKSIRPYDLKISIYNTIARCKGRYMEAVFRKNLNNLLKIGKIKIKMMIFFEP